MVRAWRALERFAEGRYAAPAVVLGALLVYAFASIAWPLAGGRDLGTYLRVYLQIFDPNAVYPQAMLARTPLAPLAIGGLLEIGGVVAEALMGLLYALSVLAWCAVARRFGTAAAVATAVALLLYPGYAMLFHRLSTDVLFAAGFAFAAVLVARALEHPSAGRAAALGAAVAGLVLIRPASQVLLVLVLVPLLAAGAWRLRLAQMAAFAAAAALPLAAWVVHNGVRFDDYTVARGGGVSVPFFRAFVVDRIVSPENGPASRELAQAVETGLLPYEPYRSYGITLEEYFESGSARMHEDLINLSDRVWGWDDDYAHVSAAGWEAVRAHPGTFASAVAEDVGILLRTPMLLDVPEEGGDGGAGGEPETIVVDGRTLPKPTEGEPIPAARESGFASTPDDLRVREVWTSPTDHHLVFRDPADARRAAELERGLGDSFDAFPSRQGSAALAEALNTASRLYPRNVVLLLVGLVAVAVRRPRGWQILAALVAPALLLCVATMTGVYPVAEYVVPLAPAFVLLAAAGLVGERR